MVETRPEPSLKQMADRVEALLAAFDAVNTPRQARENAEALVQAIVGLYGAGLEHILTIVHDELGGQSDAVFEKLCDDRFVESLLCLHGLHPLAVEERVQLALDSVRPYLKSHEGGVDIERVEGDVVILRMEGSCDGCPSSAATVKLAVERAILERVPEIREVRAENVAPPTHHAMPSVSLRIESEWLELESLPGLAERGSAARELLGSPVLFVRFDETIYAYRNECPSCRRALDDGALERPFLTCAACGNAYDMVHAGRARDDRSFVEPFPAVRENGRIRVAIPLPGA